MIYANVNENGRIELDRALKDAKDKKWYRRLKIIDLSSQGRKQTIPWSKKQWLELLNQAPSQFEKLESGAQNWTQALLADY